MKTKIILTSFVAVFVAMTFVFALTTLSPTTLKFTEPTTNATFSVTNLDASINPATYIITNPTIMQENDLPIIFSLSDPQFTLTTSSPKTITVTTNVDYNEIGIGKTYSGNIVVKKCTPLNNDLVAYDCVVNTTEPLNLPITFTSSFCSAGEKGTDLEISNVEIDNSDGDEDAWSPLDEISIEVEVSNEGDEKINDVFIEIGLYDSEGRNLIKDMDDLDDDEIDLGNIKDGDEDTATFKFTVPADFESGNFRLVVKAYSDDVGENELCTAHASDLNNDVYQTISGEREEDEEKHVIFDNIKLTPSPAQCSERVQITGEVSNIGDNDYEDQVKVTLYNKDLGLNVEKIVREDLEQGDSELVDFEFDVPKNADEKSYVLEFKTYYEYDEDDDDYGITSDKTFTESLRVEGNCKIEETKNVALTAELDAETPQAIAGKQVIINAVLKNTGTTETTYLVSVSGAADEWSSIVSINPQAVTLQSGQSREISIILNINEDVEGEKELTLKTSFDGSVKEQKLKMVVVSSEERQDQQEQLQPVVKHLRENWFIYLIIVVNIILIIAIILVIRSMVTPHHAM